MAINSVSKVFMADTTPFTHFKCNDNAGNTVVTDNGSGANNGTASTNTSNLSITGKINQAFNFNNQRVNIDAVFNDIKTDQTGVIVCWINLNSFNGYNCIFSFGDTDAYGLLKLLIEPDGRVYVRAKDSVVGDKWYAWTSAGAVTPDNWYHVVLVQNGIEPKLYLNGQLISITFLEGASLDKTAWFNACPNLDNGRIACTTEQGLGNIEHINGIIDDFRYYQNKVLSLSEIQALYNSGNGTESNPSVVNKVLSVSKANISKILGVTK